MAKIAEDTPECSYQSLDLDIGHTLEVKESSMFCSCTGACKTNRCMCKRLDRGYTPGKCKCKPCKCSRQKEEPAIDMEVLGELHSSDSEPEDFCICKDACNNTLCYCLAIKQEACKAQCKCDKKICINRAPTPNPDATADAQKQQDVSLPIEEDVQRYCATRSKEELEKLLVEVASRCLQLWRSVSKSDNPASSNVPHLSPPWCKCGKCRMEADPQDQICCKNHPKNNENPHFFQLCLDQ